MSLGVHWIVLWGVKGKNSNFSLSQTLKRGVLSASGPFLGLPEGRPKPIILKQLKITCRQAQVISRSG